VFLDLWKLYLTNAVSSYWGKRNEENVATRVNKPEEKDLDKINKDEENDLDNVNKDEENDPD
jgi:hypothetical protein